MKMKEGNYFRLRHTHLFLTLISLSLAIALLWDLEKETFNTILQQAEDQVTSFSRERPIEEKDDHLTITAQTKFPFENVDAPSMDFTTSFIPEVNAGDVDGTSSSKTEVCNYAKGRWVADSRQPLYSHQCKYIQRNWVCRTTERPDFSYEGYRWQPKDCELPEFDRSASLRRMQDKTIVFIGDSLSRTQFQSMMCMLTGGEDSPDVIDIASEYGFVHGKPGGPVHHDGWAYKFLKTNTTILHYWSARLCDLDRNITNPSAYVAMHLDRPPAFIRQNLHQFDVLVLNTEHHWIPRLLRQDNRVMYVNGKPNEDEYLTHMHNAKNFTVRNLVKWLDSQLSLHPKLKVFFRTVSPNHFRHGDWNTGGRCDNLVPMTQGSEVFEDGSRDQIIEAAVQGTKVKILDITALSELRDEAHISHYSDKANDCLHWCLPGVPDTWNEILIAQI